MDEVLASAIAASTAVITFWEKLTVVGGELLDLDQPSLGETEEEHPRNVNPRQLCEDSLFGQMLKSPEALLAPQTAEAKLFRKRFRLPYQVFLELVKCVRNGEWFVVRGSGGGHRGLQDHILVEYKVKSKLEAWQRHQ